jgi:hypothetical protein
MTAEISREVVRAPLPDLITGPGTTSSSALHRVWFLGRIGNWDIEGEAWQHFQNTDWNRHRQVINYRAVGDPSPANLAREQYHCGDEAGVQSRFAQNVGQVIMSAVSVAMGVDLVFGDYKASLDRPTGFDIRDIICMTRNGGVRILGEIKTPWVNYHGLEEAIRLGGNRLRQVLGKQERDIL